MSILVIDVGTSGVRAAVVHPDATVTAEHRVEVLPSTPAPGLVEFDAAAMAEAALEVARRSLAEGGPGRRGRHRQPAGVDRSCGTGPPACRSPPGWAGRTCARSVTAWCCRPRASASPPTSRPPRSPTSSTTPTPTAAATSASAPSTPGSCGTSPRVGCTPPTSATPASPACSRPTPPAGTTPCSIACASPSRLPAIARRLQRRGRRGHRPPRRARRSAASPATSRPRSSARGAWPPARPRSPSAPGACSTWWSAPSGRPSPAGVRPAPSRSSPGVGVTSWCGASRRSCCRPARTWSGCATTSGSSPTRPRHTRSRPPAPTPRAWCTCPPCSDWARREWDFGARGALLGVTRGTGRGHVVRAVLEGVAQRGADLVEAAEADAATTIPTLRVDGGMSDNPTFVQALADATQRPVEVSPVTEATTLGAAFLAGLAVGTWAGLGRRGRRVAPASGRRAGRSARPRPMGPGRRTGRRVVPRAVGPRLLIPVAPRRPLRPPRPCASPSPSSCWRVVGRRVRRVRRQLLHELDGAGGPADGHGHDHRR